MSKLEEIYQYDNLEYSEEESENEFYQEKDYYEEIDKILEINSKIREYIKKHSLSICENLKNNDIVKHLYY